MKNSETETYLTPSKAEVSQMWPQYGYTALMAEFVNPALIKYGFSKNKKVLPHNVFLEVKKRLNEMLADEG